METVSIYYAVTATSIYIRTITQILYIKINNHAYVYIPYCLCLTTYPFFFLQLFTMSYMYSTVVVACYNVI